MHFHFEGLGPSGNGLANMAESKEPDRLLRELTVDALGRAGRVGPFALAQMSVGIFERHMSFQQRRHHIFRDSLFVPEAIAYNG